MQFVCGVAENAGGLAQVEGGPGEVGGCYEVGIGFRGGGIMWRSCGVQPVTKLKPCVPQVCRACLGIHEVHPGFGTLVLIPEDLRVAEAFVEGPRGQHSHVAPYGAGSDGGPFVAARDYRDVPGDGAVGQLLDGDVLEPGAEHSGAVIEEGCCGGEDLDVAGPAQPLVALGAVGGDVHKVASHAPPNVFVKPVQVRVGAFEPAGPLHIRVVDAGHNIVFNVASGPAV